MLSSVPDAWTGHHFASVPGYSPSKPSVKIALGVTRR